jgi:hypothetical protein
MKLEDLKKDVDFFFSEQYWELFVEFTDDEISILEMSENNLPRKGFILRLAIFGLGFIRSIASHISGRMPQINIDADRPETLILCGSENEYKSTKFVEDNTDSNLLYCGAFKTKGNAPVQAYLFGVLFFPLLVIHFFYSTAKQRNLYKFLSDQFLLVMGWRMVQRDIYRRRNIGTVVYSNHVSPASRSAVALAREFSNAVIIYVEHTPILAYWPAVDADVYCLSGQFSLNNMMKRSVPHGKDIYLLGSPKNDAIKFRKKRSSNCHIGLCVSTVDDMEVVRNLISSILSYDASTKLIIRPHPSFRNFEVQLALVHPRLFIRKPIDQCVEDYLSSIDRLLVNDSGIFFEGLLAGVQVIRIKISDKSLNNYNVPEEFSYMYDKSISEVTTFILSNDSVDVDLEKVKFFFGNVATEFENNASEILSMVIASYGVSETSMAKKNRIKNYFSELKLDNWRIFSLRTSGYSSPTSGSQSDLECKNTL